MNSTSHRIVIVGAGRVATHLGKALLKSGSTILQVFNRSPENGRNLAQILTAQYVSQVEQVTSDAHLYIIAVNDDAISEIAQQLSAAIQADSMVVHVSGATPASALSPYFKNYGCFYPLQTFSLEKQVNFGNIPLCVHSPHAQLQNMLQILAATISSHVHIVDDTQRAALHVAAVFANNFTNHLFHQAQNILLKANLPFSLLLPLMEETVEKVKTVQPFHAQTGPAVRNDTHTMKNHLGLLDYDEFLKSIYETMSKSIRNTHETTHQ